MVGNVSGVFAKNMVGILVTNPLSKTDNMPEKDDNEQSMGNVKTNSSSPLQGKVIYSGKGEFSAEKVTASQDTNKVTESQVEAFDQYF